MQAIDSTVSAKLQAQRGQAEALAIWKKLWAAYEREGIEGTETCLAGLLELPNGEGGEGDVVERP